MAAEDRQREYRRELWLASLLIVAGLAASALALTMLTARDAQQIAQATPPTQSTPGAETKPAAPPEPGTTGQRPTDIPPQPARPDPDAQKSGAQPALPPAPAEKVAPPIREK
jgi:outer membrane biosynthesis protein TonB